MLEMNRISKQYGDNAVLNDVSLKVKSGEIHALLGENGAGKSTLMNILFGMPVIHNTGGFQGEVLINGEKQNISSPHDAMLKGIGMVHQEFMLIPGFTITENIKLNREVSKPNIISKLIGKDLEILDMATMEQDARKALDAVGMSVDEHTLVKGLPVGYMQFVEIAREIDKEGIKLLVFDEPTAVLTESEAEQLISVMKSIAEKGIAIIFITHRLDEVMNACDSVTVLRDGKLVKSMPTNETSIINIAKLMIGRASDDVAKAPQRTEQLSGNIAMEIKDLHVSMPGERVRGLNLEVMEGEILGIGGLAGQGKIGLPNGIMGLFEATGEVKLFGKKLPLNNAKEVLKQGVAMVSEDRRGVGLLLDESIANNIAFNAIQVNGKYLYNILGFASLMNTRAVYKLANDFIKQLDIRCTSAAQHTGTLSGGNQQKVCIARALALDPKFLFVSEPTRGIDIGAKRLVLETLTKLNRKLGMTIVMVSSELNELRSIADRIAVVSEGVVVDILSPEASDADFGLAMSGIKPGSIEGGNSNEN